MGPGSWDFLLWLDGVHDHIILSFNTYENAAAMRDLIGRVADNPNNIPQEGYYKDDNGLELSFRARDTKAIRISERTGE